MDKMLFGWLARFSSIDIGAFIEKRKDEEEEEAKIQTQSQTVDSRENWRKKKKIMDTRTHKLSFCNKSIIIFIGALNLTDFYMPTFIQYTKWSIEAYGILITARSQLEFVCVTHILIVTASFM